MNLKRAYRDFLHVIEKLTSVFAEMYNAIINVIALTTNYEAQLFIIIKKFHYNIRLKKMRKKKHSHLAQLLQLTKTKKVTNFETTNLSRAETSHFEIILNQYVHAFAIKSIITLTARI